MNTVFSTSVRQNQTGRSMTFLDLRRLEAEGLQTGPCSCCGTEDRLVPVFRGGSAVLLGTACAVAALRATYEIEGDQRPTTCTKCNKSTTALLPVKGHHGREDLCMRCSPLPKALARKPRRGAKAVRLAIVTPFARWLLKQAPKRAWDARPAGLADPVGDFAGDFAADIRSNPSVAAMGIRGLRRRLRLFTSRDEVLEALEMAWAEFKAARAAAGNPQ